MNSKEHSYLVNNAIKNPKLTAIGKKFLVDELNVAIQKVDMTKLKSTKKGYVGGSSLRISEHLRVLSRSDTKRFREAIGNTITEMLKNPEKYGLNDSLSKLKKVEKHHDHALGSSDETENRKRPAWFFGYSIEEQKDDMQVGLSGFNPEFVASNENLKWLDDLSPENRKRLAHYGCKAATSDELCEELFNRAS
jgi:hypothetical protein